MPPPIDTARLAEAQSQLAAVRSDVRSDARWRALDLRISSLTNVASLPSSEALRKLIAVDPGDADARLQLAQQYIAQQEFEPALEQLLEVIARTHKADYGNARRTMLSIFELLPHQPQLVSHYRRRLSALLNR